MIVILSFIATRFLQLKEFEYPTTLDSNNSSTSDTFYDELLGDADWKVLLNRVEIKLVSGKYLLLLRPVGNSLVG